jgi:hypothetical protein
MTRTIVTGALWAAWLVPAAGAEARKETYTIKPNVWVKAELRFELPKDIPGARWSTTDGYCGSTFRSKMGTVLWRTGVRSKKANLSPGFYSNATLEWDPATDVARTVNVQSHWSGGSYGGGRLLEGFEAHVEPAPRHTYDGLTYVAEQDAMYVMLGANGRMRKRATERAKKQLALGHRSTWKLSLEPSAWTRIDGSIRKFWPSGYKVSPYESHLQHWPEGRKLLFFDSRGKYYAVFDLKTETWSKGELKNACPMRLYNARSTWDSKRQLWVFRLGPWLAAFDPCTGTFRKLPHPYPVPEDKKDRRRATKGVAYVSKHDVYLIAGPTGNDTYAWHPEAERWEHVRGGDLKMVNGYMEYDPASDVAVMVYQHHAYRFRYVPGADAKETDG